MQGDEPTLDPSFIRTAYALLQNPAVDIGTVASVITDAAKKTAPQVAKAVFDVEEGSSQGRALYFTRNPAPWGEGAQYHHAGLYAYRREALARFVATPPSPLEKREKLEQLRALSLGLRIDVAIVPTRRRYARRFGSGTRKIGTTGLITIPLAASRGFADSKLCLIRGKKVRPMIVGHALLAALIELTYAVLDMAMWALILSAILSWLVAFDVINTRNNVVRVLGDFLYRVTEPFLRPIRRLLPQTGNVDLSPLVLIFIIWFLQSFLRHLVIS